MIKKHKNKIILCSIVAIGILFILFGSFSKDKSEVQTYETDFNEYTEQLENKIENFLLDIDGISKVKVIITLDNSSERILAQNENSYDYLVINSSSGENAVDINLVYPKVRGVAIACTNGNNSEIQKEVTEIISSYLGISSNRIKIVSIK